jgi:ABC-type Fe3+-siderophore transport system permease subunit
MTVRLGRAPRWLSAAAVGYSFCLAGCTWFFAGVQRCFERCYDHADPRAATMDWDSFSDAWQWPAIVVLGIAGLGLSALMAALVWRDLRAASVGAAVAWLAAAVAAAALIQSGASHAGSGVLAWLGLGIGFALVGGTMASVWLAR